MIVVVVVLIFHFLDRLANQISGAQAIYLLFHLKNFGSLKNKGIEVS